ncbi:MAG: type II toxin-antitoxin system VapC family toxin [Acidobacteria bacterium]|nr:type II toxin-antitoxin system VapC family toxin [Acidobacteriota bacterium]
MKAVLVDSDVLIEVLRQADAGIAAKWEAMLENETLLMYSPVTAAEVWHGVRDREQTRVAAAFSVMACVPIDHEIGQKAGQYLRSYHASHNIGLGDALIAASAVLHEIPLWTRNRKHYPMKELKLC